MIKRMLEFVKQHDVRPWIQKYDMKDVNQALPDFRAGKPRYRFVLVNTENGGVL
jgi:D-arabinose 1-dehydrogenase-like Zn-dependent alcohol dehydrogenase